MNVKNESVTHRSTFFLFVRCLIILGLLNNALITFDKSEILLLLPFPYYDINNLRSALEKKWLIISICAICMKIVMSIEL